MAQQNNAGNQSLLNPTNNVQWMQIQKDTFTNWVNEQLKPKGLSVHDLRTDFANGVLLVTLVEALKRQQLAGTVNKPNNQYQKLQNITVALDAIADDNVRIINIDSKEISEGNSKLILALVWQLILRYQIGLSNIQHRNWMLSWLQAVIPECKITNFSSDWNDGTALFALLDFCIQGHHSNWQNLDRTDRENNCRMAMKIARQQFGIPLILRPEHLASAELDEMSAITYLSYFMKVGAPGYNATLQRIQPLVRNAPVFNFTTDWNDGRVLCELVTNLGVVIPSWPEGNASSIDLLQQGIDGGKSLDVEPVLTAAEMSEEDSEHLGIMAYAAKYIHLKPSGAAFVSRRTEQVILVDKKIHRQRQKMENNSPPTAHISQRQVLPIENGTSPKIVTVRHHKDKDPHYSVVNPSTARPADDDSGKRTYSLMNAERDDKLRRSFNFIRTPSMRKAHKKEQIPDPEEEEMKLDTFCVGVILKEKHTGVNSKEMIRLEAESPTGRIIKLTGDGHYNAQFGPDEIGKWKISMYCDDKVINAGTVDVCDPSQVRVTGLKSGVVGKAQKFKVDCRKAGSGEVEVFVNHKNGRVPCYFTEPSPNLYVANFTPFHPGVYHIGISFNKADIQGADTVSEDGSEGNRRAVFVTTIQEESDHTFIKSTCDWQIDYITGGPFEIKMKDTADVKVYSMLDGTICNTPHLIADCSDHPHGTIDAEVVYNSIRFPAEVTEEKPGVYRISFRPRGPGIYKVWVIFDGVVVKGCPFVQEIEELTSPSATGDGLLYAEEEKEAEFRVDARGFPGELSVQVKGPRRAIPCQIRPNSDGSHKVTYIPEEVGWHRIHVRLDNKDIDKSPFKLPVTNPSKVRVSGGWRPLLDDRERIPLVVNKEKQIPFDASEAGPGELTAEVHGPSSKIPVVVDSRTGSKHTLVFTPKEEGKHYIDVRWSSLPLSKSPYLGYATLQPENSKPTFQSVILLQNGESDSSSSDSDTPTNDSKRRRRKRPVRKQPSTTDSDLIKPTNPRILVYRKPSDISSSGRKRDSLHHQPSLRSTTTVSDGDSIKGPRISAVYTPTHLSGSTKSSKSPKDQHPATKVILSGPGLKEASVNRTAYFYIDGRKAPPGTPDVAISSVKTELPVEVEQTGPQLYKCTYKPPIPGAYLLDIKWNKRPLKCCPLKVNVHSKPTSNPSSPRTNSVFSYPPPSQKPLERSRPSSVVGSKLKEAVVGRPIQFIIDPKQFGPGELKVDCVGPHGEHVPVYSNPHADGTVGVQLRPVGPGRHILNVRFNNRHILQSPYAIDVKVNEAIGTVDVYGPGIANGVLPFFEGQFWVDARDAGAGELHVSIMGPKGAFRVEMHRKSQKTKLFDCRYNPVEPGIYTVNVFWSGVHVKNSPYFVLLATSERELDRMELERKASLLPLPSSRPVSDAGDQLMY